MPRRRNVCPSGIYRHDAPSCVSSTIWLLSSLRGLTTEAFSSNSIFTATAANENVCDATQIWNSQRVLLWKLTRFGPQRWPDMSPHSAFASYTNVMGLNISGFTAAETPQCHLSPLLWLSHNLKFSWIQRAACRQLILKTELCVKLGGKKRRKKKEITERDWQETQIFLANFC